MDTDLDFLARIDNAITGTNVDTPTSIDDIPAVDLDAKKLQIIGEMTPAELRLHALKTALDEERRLFVKDANERIGAGNLSNDEIIALHWRNNLLEEHGKIAIKIMWVSIQARFAEHFDHTLLLVDGNKVAKYLEEPQRPTSSRSGIMIIGLGG